MLSTERGPTDQDNRGEQHALQDSVRHQDPAGGGVHSARSE